MANSLRNNLIAALLAALSALAPVTSVADELLEIARMSLEDLLRLDVTSVSKRSQPLDETAAATFVITKADIRRSGATQLPDILRMVPGMNVAQVATGEWAVSSRGFNGVFADKLLVLIDGRTIYTSIFSGTFWDEHDLVLEDINRIEVVRGPGATLWGANAVNGIINIITDDARDTHGTMVSAIGGDEDRLITSFHQGGAAGATNYRVFGKFADRDNAELVAGGPAHDKFENARGGFRTDTEIDADNDLTVEAEGLYFEKDWNLQRVTFAPPFVETFNSTRSGGGGHIRGRWVNRISETSELSLQSYYDHMSRNDTINNDRRDTFDTDFQHRFRVTEGNELIWGLGYRLNSDRFENTFYVGIEPDHLRSDLYTGFIQDEITLAEGLKLIFGTKVEHNYYSGWEVQPNVRTIWNATEHDAVWAAVSRAVRSPARFNQDGRLTIATIPTETGLPGVLTFNGDDNYDSGIAVSYEAGYRHEIGNTLTADLAVFYTDIDNADTSRAGGDPFFVPAPQPHVEIPFIITNDGSGESLGAELALNYRPFDWWRLAVAYSHLNVNLNIPESDFIYGTYDHLAPRNQVHLRSMMDLPYDLELDLIFRYVDNVSTYSIPAYNELDARLAWKACENFEVALVGKNLLNGDHQEFLSNFVSADATELQRAVFASVTYRR